MRHRFKSGGPILGDVKYLNNPARNLMDELGWIATIG
ncbi:hypothetical protein KOR42_28920 [Thalassoglobus neptunius]|uniref:Uncharacterized protein n=1 Tax=Thalassoglobus neptunius TaxID=1938619 RepID=A0A5C5WZB5_9PLAN|nr:hypothetical protein KOR42_28920 [Thalassoglobus neptunius]